MKEEKVKDPSMNRLLAINADEWPFIVIGCISSLAQGAVHPGFALIFGTMLGVSFLRVFCTMVAM